MSHDYGDEIALALRTGKGFIGSGDTVETFMKKVREVKANSPDSKKCYTFRLKVSTVNKLKTKAAAAGVPYQTFVNALLDAV